MWAMHIDVPSKIPILRHNTTTIRSTHTNTPCFRLRIGDYYTTVYETPVPYALSNTQREQEMQNIDFGEKLGECDHIMLIVLLFSYWIAGGSGYPGQQPLAHWSESPIVSLFSVVHRFN